MKMKKKYLRPRIKTRKLQIGILFTRNWDEDVMFLTQCVPDCIDCVPSCFLPGTKISIPHSFKNIENLKVDDVILSFNISRSRLTQSRVKRVLVEKENKYLIFNNHIKVTPFHRFWVDARKWVRAKDLKVGDRLFDTRGREVQVKDIKVVNKQSTVYNLSLFGVYKNFFAEDVLVHNYKCV